MKKFYLIFGKWITKHLLCFLLVFALFSFMGLNTQAQITSTISAGRCGEGPVVLRASASSGTIKWYSVPFYGTPITSGVSDDGNVFTTPTLGGTTTYFVDALDNNNCSLNSGGLRVPVTATVSASAMQAIIFYSSSTFCNSVNTPQAVTRTGTAGGTYTYTGTGTLSLNASTGAIIPSTSANGTYTITYTVIAAEGCVENPASTTVTITTAPVVPTISYSGSPWCTSSSAVSVTRTGASGGTFSAAPSGLSINSGTGTLTPSSSLSGTYTVTYNVPGAGGCPPLSTTTTVEILQLPTASISYATPFTKNQGSQAVSLTGTGVYTGGAFTKTGGAGVLTLNSSTGAIDPSTSDAGTYTITYTLSAVSPCAQVSTTTDVTIYTLPTASVSGSTYVCLNATEPLITFTGANGVTPYTFTYNVNGGPNQTVITSSGSSVTVAQATSNIASYTYNLLSVSDGNGSSQSQTGSATVSINRTPVALFSYPATPYCSNDNDPTPSFLDGGVAGTFSSTAGLVFVSTATGEIDLSASTAGTYTVTNTIGAANGCSQVVATSDITITRLQDATFSYAGSPYCSSGGSAVPTVNDIGVFTCDNQFLSFMEGDGVAPGTINLDLTPVGIYTITNTISAIGGCAITIVETATIEIQSAPEVTNSGFYQICSGENTSITLMSNPSEASFTWTIGTVVEGITGASDGSGTLISQVLNNSSNTEVGTVEYNVIPTLGTGACSVGSTFTIVVAVNPLPVAPTAGDLSVTYDGSAHTASATAPSGASVVWYDAATNGNVITAPSATNVGTYTAYAESVFDATSCKSATRTLVTLQIDKQPLAAATIVAPKVYNGTAVTGTVVLGEVTGLIDTETLDITPLATNFADANVGASKATTISYTLVNGTGLASNYSMANLLTTGAITAKPLTAATTVASKVYNGTTVTGTVVLGEVTGLIDTETLDITPLSTNFADANVGASKATTISYTLSNGTGLASNYSMANFPTTGAIIEASITELGITGIIAPERGATPVTEATNTIQYTAAVAWSGAPTTFAGGTEYTATIIISPTGNYTLTGVNANVFTVAGATSVTHLANSGEVSAVFPVTIPEAPGDDPNQSFCSGSDIDDLKTVLIGSAIKVYEEATGENEYTDGSTLLITATHYYVTQTVNGVESTPRKEITVTINPLPDVSNFAVSAVTICAGSGAVVSVSSNSLADGNYIVTYNVSGTNDIASTTATMNFSGDSGTFTTADLPTAGSSNVVNTTLIAFAATPTCTTTSVGLTASFSTLDITATPVVTFPIYYNATTVGGTCESGAVVTVYVNGANPVIAVTNTTSWTATVPSLDVDDVVTATAIVEGMCVSAVSNSVTVTIP